MLKKAKEDLSLLMRSGKHIFVFVLYCSYEMSFLTTCFELKRQECTASIIETGLTALKHIRPLF